MTSNWVNALDACAAAGIIDYDAPAFITGKKPRYYGHPDMEKLPLKNDFLLPGGIKLKDVPELDTYTQAEDKQLVQNPIWKKILFGAIALTGIAAGVIGLTKLSKIKMPNFKNVTIKFPKLIKFSDLKKTSTDICKKAWDCIKMPFLYIAKKIKF